MASLCVSVVVKRLVTSIVLLVWTAYAAGDFCSYVALFLVSTVLITIVTVSLLFAVNIGHFVYTRFHIYSCYMSALH